MQDRDNKLNNLLKAVERAEPVPDFEETWRRAEAASDHNRRRTINWRPMIVPAGAFAALLALALTVFEIDLGNQIIPDAGTFETSTDPAETLATLTMPEAWTGTLDDFAPPSVIKLDWGTIEEDEQQDDTVLMGNGNADELPTDFLLEIDTLAWEEAEERSL
jgi:hypothetical protein